MNVKEAINYRYSARKLDALKKIPREDFNLILEAGVKAPSGFGAEPWKFLVIEGDKTKLLDACYHQPAVANCSHLVVFLYALPKLLKTPFLTDRINQMGNNMSEEKQMEYLNRILSLAEGSYMREQTMFAASQMSIQAAGIGVDSLIMGGFNPQALAQVLNVDETLYGVSLIVAFGYSTTEPKKREHRPFNEVVEFIKL